jgi:6-pyruvoyl-tetrahydropterin synthase
MIDITQIFFLDNNDLTNNKQKSSILARWDYNYENYLWDNMKEEREEKENHGQTGQKYV